VAPALADLEARLAALEAWDEKTVEAAFQATIDTHGLKLGQLAQPVRVATTGGTVSPGIYEVLDVLGRERSLARLRRVTARLASA
jgi:glutamyl-tRNA synthetase